MKVPDSGVIADKVTAAMREVAETIILPRFNQLAKGDVRSKTHPADLVTIADEESERALGPILRGLLPNSLVIGEEAASADPKVLEHLLSEEFVWIIDPIDGTANFVNGKAAFAVMIALVHSGETIMGWIHEPLENRTLTAERGAGTWRTSPSLPTGPAKARLTVEAPGTQLSEMTAGIYSRDLAHIKGKFGHIVRIGSAAHDYWALVENRMQVLCYRRLKPWDHAAGILMHSEAGGYNRLFSGERYSAARANQIGLLCTPTEGIWRAVVALAPEVQSLTIT
jgi:fructose-1,6-bisphosphatase/inositol monophosphatase family enzyme